MPWSAKKCEATIVPVAYYTGTFKAIKHHFQKGLITEAETDKELLKAQRNLLTSMKEIIEGRSTWI